MKGIILAGGLGTRLYPLTEAVIKQLLPVYDKPMIYYPLSTLMLAGIKDILIISTPQDLPLFKKFLGSGKKWGIKLTYAVQKKPKGIAQAFLVGEKFIGKESCCLILGDNLFFGNDLQSSLIKAVKNNKGVTIFAYPVKDTQNYGIIEFDKLGNPKSIKEKPSKTISNYAVTGIYFYTNDVVKIAKKMKMSKRGEYEISSINQYYLKKLSLNVEIMGRGMAWLDTGTHESLIEAAEFVKVLQKRQGLMISCPEEIAWRQNWISTKDLKKLSNDLAKTDYGKYLKNLIREKKYKQ